MLRKNSSKPPLNLDGSNKSIKRRKTKNKDNKDAPGSKPVEAVDHGGPKRKSKRSSEIRRKKKNIDLDESVKKPAKKKRPGSRRKKHDSKEDSEKKKKGSKALRKKKEDEAGSPKKKEKEKDKDKDKDKDGDGSERRVKKEKDKEGSIREKRDSERVVRKNQDKSKEKIHRDKDKEADKEKEKDKEKDKKEEASERNKKSPPHALTTPPIGSASSQPVSNPTQSPNLPQTPAATPPNATPNVALTPNQQAADNDDSDDEEESSGGKTPPNTPEPNEGASEEQDAAGKSTELAMKGDVLSVGGIKLMVQETLKGSYGMGVALTKEVDKKIDIISAGAQVNLKYEKHSAKVKKLMIETEIIKHAHANQKPCVPVYIESGEHNNFNCLIVDGMGPSLVDLIEKLNGFSPPTIFKIALITIDLLRIFHSMLYLHRDIRPHVFHVGKEGHRNRIIIGCITSARKYGIRKEIEPEEKCDLEIRKPKFRTKVWHPRKKVLFIGSVKYAPRSSHQNKEHTRRDDVESWFYMIYEFLNKSLPWKNMTDKEKIYEAKNEFLQDQKFSDDVQRKYGPEMVNICEYFGVQNYYEMEPDYTYIELCILNLLKDANKNSQSEKFDWEQQPSVFNPQAPATSPGTALEKEKPKT